MKTSLGQVLMQIKIQEQVCFHSLLWLFLGNLVGFLLSILLVFPDYNSLIAPLTYGRIVPLHLNFHLYGWSAIPLIGILFYWYLDLDHFYSSVAAMTALLIWSFALCLGGFSWLFGYSSGKIFLEWSGVTSVFFIFALSYLWWVLYRYSIRPLGRVKSVMLTILGFIPLIFYFALDPAVYPPVNFESSGATGASLMISTLAIIGIFLLFPIILKITTSTFWHQSYFFYALCIHIIFWALIPHGHSSHYQLSQIIGLGSLMLWIPGIWIYYLKFSWPESSKIWRNSFLFWMAILFPSAWGMFLPNVLNFAKFSSFIVGHVHIAMAGMTTSFLMFILSVLLEAGSKTSTQAKKLSRRLPFVIWQGGLVIHLLSLFLIGNLEVSNFGVATYIGSLILSPYLLRTLSGMLMLLGSSLWLIGACIDLRERHLVTSKNVIPAKAGIQ